MKNEIVKCPSCGKEVPDDANFCPNCAAKLVTVCNCWVLGETYDCGLKECPGYELYCKMLKGEISADKIPERFAGQCLNKVNENGFSDFPCQREKFSVK